MKRAVLMGGSGFLGSGLSRSLIKRGWRVVSMDASPPREEGVEWIEADVFDPVLASGPIERGDAVFHLVHSSIPGESMLDPAGELEKNLVPYVRFIDLIAEAGAETIVYYSTGGQIYGSTGQAPASEKRPERPVSGYGACKAAMEQFTRLAKTRKGLDHLILRPSNPYGPGQEITNRHGAIPALMKRALYGGSFTAYGNTVRDYIFIDDASEAAAALVESGARNATVNVGSGAGTSLLDLVRAVEKVTGKRIETEREPIRPGDVDSIVLDVSLLKKLSGFEPSVGLAQGLQRTWKYFKDHEEE